MTDGELRIIREKFPGVKIDAAGYGTIHYPTIGSFSDQGGALIFDNGHVYRVPAPWQLDDFAPPSSNIVTVNAQEVFPVQSTIGWKHNNGFTVKQNIDALRSGLLSPDDFKDPIRVFVKHPSMNDWPVGRIPKHLQGVFEPGDFTNLQDYRLYSLDNRRAVEFRTAGMQNIPVVWLNKPINISQEGWKFSTPNFGNSIEVIKGPYPWQIKLTD